MARRVEHDDVTFYHRETDAAPVVMLPGLVAGSWIWNAAVERLTASGYSCLTIRDAVAVTHDSISNATRSVTETFERFGIERATVCGASLGSIVALSLAARHPHLVDCLVLSGAPSMKVRPDFGINPSGKFTRSIAFSVAKGLFYDRSCIGDDVVENAFRLFVQRSRLLNMIKLLREAGNFDVRPILRQIQCDTLMIWGEQDTVSPATDWAGLAPLVEGGVFATIPACGHLPMIERPDAFNDIFLRFLAARSSSGSAALAELRPLPQHAVG